MFLFLALLSFSHNQYLLQGLNTVGKISSCARGAGGYVCTVAGLTDDGGLSPGLFLNNSALKCI